jgi:GNAT superfamily N-acetyltransferase
MTQDISIRYAKANDLAAILGLIMDLAIYEKAEDEVKVTLLQLTQDFEEGNFQAQVAVNEYDEVMGMTLYYITYSTWKGKMLYLEDFVTAEKYRRKGIGRLLFNSVIAEAKKQNCKLMKWQVLDWNEPAIDFYKSYDATIETNWFNGKIIF